MTGKGFKYPQSSGGSGSFATATTNATNCYGGTAPIPPKKSTMTVDAYGDLVVHNSDGNAVKIASAGLVQGVIQSTGQPVALRYCACHRSALPQGCRVVSYHKGVPRDLNDKREAFQRAVGYASALNSGVKPEDFRPHLQTQAQLMASAFEWVSIDTLPHLAKDGAKPQAAPTDAEIVAVYETFQREEAPPWTVGSTSDVNGKVTALWVGSKNDGRYVSMADVRAAWSRELKRKQAEAKEADRRQIAVQVDHPDFL